MTLDNIHKLLAGTLALVLVAGVGSPAFADPANAGVPVIPLTAEQEARVTDAPFAEVGDAGQLPGTAQTVQGVSGAVTAITGSISTTNDVDMFSLCLTDASNWEALAVQTSLDPMLSLFDNVGNGFVHNDDNSPPGAFGARIGDLGPNVPAAPQEVLLAISSFSNRPLDGAALMHGGPTADGQFTLTGTVDGWNNNGVTSGGYQIILTGFAELSACTASPVAGELMSLNTGALLLGGLATSAFWIVPIAAAAGTGIYIAKTRLAKDEN